MRKITIFSIVVIFLLAGTAFSEDRDMNDGRGTVAVSGGASGHYPPDAANVILAVETTDRTVGPAVKANSEKAQAVTNALKGIINKDRGDTIKTSHYSVEPVYKYDRDGGERKLLGYKVINQVTIKVKDPALPGTIIDTAIKSGANRVDSVQFLLEEREAICNDLIRKAIAKASERAGVVAESLNVKITGIKHASSECGEERPPYLRKAYAPEEAASRPHRGGGDRS